MVNYKKVLRDASDTRKKDFHIGLNGNADVHIMTSKRYSLIRKLTKAICEDLNDVTGVILFIDSIQSKYDKCCEYTVFYEQDGIKRYYEIHYYLDDRTAWVIHHKIGKNDNQVIVVREFYFRNMGFFKELKKYIFETVLPTNINPKEIENVKEK